MSKKAGIKLGRELFGWEKALLEQGDLYLVGGAVRDLLKGKREDSPDTDYIICRVPYDDVVTTLKGFGKTNLVGKSFGVIKFTAPDGVTVDISLPRTESSTGTGHRDFDVRSDETLPVEKDLERRDFTINSMALHMGRGSIVDPLGGRDDLAKRVLRVNRPSSFVEDPLRILRGVQFMARFSLSVEDSTRALMEQHRALLGTVSPERIRDELNKLMIAPKPSKGFLFMHDTGILPVVFPELDDTWGVSQNEFHPDDVFHHSIKSCDAAQPVLAARWSALLHDLGKPKMKQAVDGRTVFYGHQEEGAEISDRILNRLRFPKEFVLKVALLVRFHMFNITDEWTDGALRRFLSKIGPENIDDLLALRLADMRSREEEVDSHVAWVRGELQRIIDGEAALKRADLEVNGKDVIRELGLEPGEQIGEVLQSLLEMVMDEPELNDRERLLELLRGMKGQKNGSSCN
jgi:tRNA nucleotidyltransferase (CCA-adding enzyme)